jgi:hypothetical protein
LDVVAGIKQKYSKLPHVVALRSVLEQTRCNDVQLHQSVIKPSVDFSNSVDLRHVSAVINHDVEDGVNVVKNFDRRSRGGCIFFTQRSNGRAC